MDGFNSSVRMKALALRRHDLIDLPVLHWIIKVIRSNSEFLPALRRLSRFLSIGVLIFDCNLVSISPIIYYDSTRPILIVALETRFLIKAIFKVTSILCCVLLILRYAIRIALILAHNIQRLIAISIKIMESFPEIHELLAIYST